MTHLPDDLEARARDFANLASLDMDDAAKAGAVGLALDFARAVFAAGQRSSTGVTIEAVKSMVLLHKNKYIGGGAEDWALTDLYEAIKYDLPLPEPPQ